MTKVLHKSAKKDMRGAVMALAPAVAMVAPQTAFAADNEGASGINGASISMNESTINFTGDYQQGSPATAFSKLISKYKVWVMGFLGIGVTTMVIFFIKNFLGLASSGNNPQKRAEQVKAVIIDFIAAAGLGAATFFVGIGFNSISHT